MRCWPSPIIAASTARDSNVSGGYDLDFSEAFVVDEELDPSILNVFLPSVTDLEVDERFIELVRPCFDSSLLLLDRLLFGLWLGTKIRYEISQSTSLLRCLIQLQYKNISMKFSYLDHYFLSLLDTRVYVFDSYQLFLFDLHQREFRTSIQ